MKKILEKVLDILPFISVFLFSLYLPVDTDLGWHLKYGEYFIKTGHILRENIFSTEMKDYLWVNHSWLSDIITYFTYHAFDFWGLSVVGAITVCLTLFFIKKAFSFSRFQTIFLFPLFLYYMDPFNKVSFRAQQGTLLLTSILVFLLTKIRKGSKSPYFLLPLLFLFWANFHGGFILGLGIFFLFIITSTIMEFSTHKTLTFNNLTVLAVLLICSVIPILNPFGLNIYIESFKHFGNPLATYIVEWTAFETYSMYWWRLLTWGLYLFISITVIYKNKKLKEYLPLLTPVLLFFLFSFWARRYTWTMFLLSLPILSYLDNVVVKPKERVSKLISLVLFLGFSLYLIYTKFINPGTLRNLNWDHYCYFLKCSSVSANLLKNQRYTSLYTFYDWGGYLIWNYPDVKPSVDGRMSFWKNEKGYSAFEENFYYEQTLKDINESKYDMVYISPLKPIYKRMQELTSEKEWELLFEDSVSAIFKRVKLYTPQIIGPSL